MLTSIVSILAACTSPPPPPLPEGNISDIKNVMVSSPVPSAIDNLSTLSRLPEGACTKTKEGKYCTIDANQVIKWRWGFCKNGSSEKRFCQDESNAKSVVFRGFFFANWYVMSVQVEVDCIAGGMRQ